MPSFTRASSQGRWSRSGTCIVRATGCARLTRQWGFRRPMQMPSREDDLRATSESIVQDAGRLRALEQQKQELDPEDPRVADLSAQIEDLGIRLRGKTAA